MSTTAGGGESTEAVRARLAEIANERTQAINLEYTVEFRQELRRLLDGAAQRMVDEGRTSDEDYANAESNLSRFLAAVVDAMRVMGFTEAREPTFQAARSQLCPLWPFC